MWPIIIAAASIVSVGGFGWVMMNKRHERKLREFGQTQEFYLSRKDLVEQMGSNSQLRSGDPVFLSPQTNWKHEYSDWYLRNKCHDLANPSDVPGVVEFLAGDYVHVEWEGGWKNCYLKKDSDLVKVEA